MKRDFVGPLSSPMQRYLELRHSLGFTLGNTTVSLAEFDRYLVSHFPQATTVTRPMVVSYLETTRPLLSQTRAARLSQLRQFCRYLFQLNPETYIPEPGLLPAKKVARCAHLYSLDQVTRLMTLARQLLPADSIRPHTYVTLLGLLWVSGLRIGEALRLNLGDVDLETGLLHIQQTKNFKSRLVPLTQSTRRALLAYGQQRSRYGGDQNPAAPFLINNRGCRCSRTPVKRTFRQLVRQLGFQAPQGKLPRLHDFRHTFATRCLDRLYQQSQDPEAYLPVLATYLGHTHLTDTQLYLHPQPELLQVAADRFSRHVSEFGNLTLRGAHGNA